MVCIMGKYREYGLIPVPNYRSREKETALMERSRYGVACQDCWNFDEYFFKVLSNGLKIYKNETNGHPIDTTPEEYEKIIEKMIVLCAIQSIDPTDYYLVDFELKSTPHAEACSKWQKACRDELFDMLKEYIGHLWW